MVVIYSPVADALLRLTSQLVSIAHRLLDGMKPRIPTAQVLYRQVIPARQPSVLAHTCAQCYIMFHGARLQSHLLLLLFNKVQQGSALMVEVVANAPRPALDFRHVKRPALVDVPVHLFLNLAEYDVNASVQLVLVSPAHHGATNKVMSGNGHPGANVF